MTKLSLSSVAQRRLSDSAASHCKPSRLVWLMLCGLLVMPGTVSRSLAQEGASKSAAKADAVNPYDQSGVLLEVDSPDPKLVKVVLLAGSVSNKAGQHEYFAGCAMLMNWLRQTPGVWPVMAREGWPKNEAILKNARAVVYYGDGGGKQPFLEPARWALLKDTVEHGAGFVLVHQAVDFPQGPEKDIQAWLGGVWVHDIGCRGHWDMEFKDFPAHAVMNGVQPFAAKGDGWLYNLHFAPDMKGVTPLLVGAVPDKSRSTVDAKKYLGRPEIIAWAYERPSGGRGFGFTGADLHKNWAEESQRRMVVNGILWAAGLEISKAGSPVKFDTADLQRNLDDKRPKDKPAAAAN